MTNRPLTNLKSALDLSAIMLNAISFKASPTTGNHLQNSTEMK